MYLEQYNPENSDLYFMLKSVIAELKFLRMELEQIKAILCNDFEAVKNSPEKKVVGYCGFLGGIIGGEEIGGIRGKEKGGNKGGGKGEIISKKSPEKIVKNEHPEHAEFAKRLADLIGANLSPIENSRLQAKNVQIEYRKTIATLLKQGYTKDHILQAVTDATRDQFWCKQFRTLNKLNRKNKEGVLYIDIFLALRQKQHKLPQRAKIIV